VRGAAGAAREVLHVLHLQREVLHVLQVQARGAAAALRSRAQTKRHRNSFTASRLFSHFTALSYFSLSLSLFQFTTLAHFFLLFPIHFLPPLISLLRSFQKFCYSRRTQACIFFELKSSNLRACTLFFQDLFLFLIFISFSYFLFLTKNKAIESWCRLLKRIPLVKNTVVAFVISQAIIAGK
jgi:hypothetical protein